MEMIRIKRGLSVDNARWERANKSIVWCWKRDAGAHQRSIFFSATIVREAEGSLSLRDPTMFYYHRCEDAHAIVLADRLKPLDATIFSRVRLQKSHHKGLSTLTFQTSNCSPVARDLIRRLQQRRPRKSVPMGRFPNPLRDPVQVSSLGKCALYAESGLSYEANLPTLSDVHELFGVDDANSGELVFGLKDPIPGLVASDPVAAFEAFADFHLAAAQAQPTQSYRRIAQLFREGVISSIYTDNVDNLFAEIGVPFKKVRTVFPTRTKWEFPDGCDTLVVVGVAADRYGIIQEARRAVRRVVVVNPLERVAPHAQNVSYIRPGDHWFKMPAEQFFEQCLR